MFNVQHMMMNQLASNPKKQNKTNKVKINLKKMTQNLKTNNIIEVKKVIIILKIIKMIKVLKVVTKIRKNMCKNDFYIIHFTNIKYDHQKYLNEFLISFNKSNCLNKQQMYVKLKQWL